MKIVGIIPSRFGSTRFPGKALADIKGKTMVQRTYEQSKKCALLNDVIIATDHEAILDEVERFGGNVIMTSAEHNSGTDRCFETLNALTEKYDYVINIQGDEPFIEPVQIEQLAQLLDGNIQLGTLVKVIEKKSELFDPNVVKAVLDNKNQGIYFSRNPIPFSRSHQQNNWLKHHVYYKHIGIYAYRVDVLKEITSLSQSSLELTESLEQLRWIENGYKIKTAITTYENIGIDTPEDLQNVLNNIK